MDSEQEEKELVLPSMVKLSQAEGLKMFRPIVPSVRISINHSKCETFIEEQD